MITRSVLSCVWVGLLYVSACGDDAGGAGDASAGASASTDGGGVGGGGSGGDAATAGTGGVGGGDAATGGTGGVGGSGSGGSAGAGMPSDMECTPATQEYLDGYRDLEPALTDCGSDVFWSFASGVPNPNGASRIEELALSTPLAANVPAAVSAALRRNKTGGNLEIWGASGAPCDPVTELLWVGELAARLECAEFTPSQVTSRLRFVWRALEPIGWFDSGVENLRVCAAGSCPGTTSGIGRNGRAISAPSGTYSVSGISLPNPGGVAWQLGGRHMGQLIAKWDVPVVDRDAPTFRQGLVRMPPQDPFGDAWYCVGDGSSRAEDPTGEGEGFVTLRNLTRMTQCISGTGTASITIANHRADVDTAEPERAMTGASASNVHCAVDMCVLFFTDTGGDWRTLALTLRTQDSVGDYFTPTLVTTPITEAYWVLIRPDGSVERSCIGGGSVHYDPTSETTISLTGISTPVTCPGDAVTPNSLDIALE